MVLVAAATIAFGAVFVILGLPSAAALRSPSDGRVALTADALQHGLVWLTLAVTAWAWLRGWGFAAVAVLWVVALAVAVRGRGRHVRVRRSHARGEMALGFGWLVVLVVALLLRLRDENFLPWIGDMGAYVNWANGFAATGHLNATWPPLFPAYLAVASAVFGTAHVGIGLPVLGMVLIVGVARVVHVLGAPRLVVLLAGALLAVQLHAVWFSTFPASESLNAPMFALWLTLLLRVLRGDSRTRLLVGGGTVMAALALLRGDVALTLLPLRVAVIVIAAVRGWRRYLPGLEWCWYAALLAALAGYWYGISKIPLYYVSMQIAALLPARVMGRLTAFGVFRPTAVTAAVLVLGALVVWCIGWLVVRRLQRGFRDGQRAAIAHDGGGLVEITRPHTRFSSWTWMPRGVLVVPAIAWVALVGGLILVNGEVARVLDRMGPVFVVGVLAAFLLLAIDVREDLRVAGGVLSVILLFYVTFQGYRLGHPSPHQFYLYWDRYLFSEVLPILVVLTCVAVWLGAERLHVLLRPWCATLPRTGATCTIGIVAMVALVAPQWNSLRLATSETFLDGAYSLTAQVAQEVESAAPNTPVIWVASSSHAVPHWPFPNTWMGFGKPLESTFGLPVVDIRTSTGGDFAPDVVLNADSLAAAFACTGSDRLVVLEAQSGDQPAAQRLTGSGYTFTPLLSDEQTISTLTQPPNNGWQPAAISVKGWVAERLPAAPDVATGSARTCRSGSSSG
ncbi:MAG: hypothetical protein FWF28_02015 [Micrococcales bacterium]|nr:hypothetical protein [Micrococcales bacterium]